MKPFYRQCEGTIKLKIIDFRQWPFEELPLQLRKFLLHGMLSNFRLFGRKVSKQSFRSCVHCNLRVRRFTLCTNSSDLFIYRLLIPRSKRMHLKTTSYMISTSLCRLVHFAFRIYKIPSLPCLTRTPVTIGLNVSWNMGSIDLPCLRSKNQWRNVVALPFFEKGL